MESYLDDSSVAMEAHTSGEPRLGFLGLGWIGRSRMESLLSIAKVHVTAVADVSAEARDAAKALVPHARAYETLQEMLEREDLDGVVISTPSALHAEQALQCLERRLAVFCQKPLGRSAPETERVVRAARDADALLGVDFCYRHVAGVEEMRRRIRAGDLGRLFHVEAVFHNAYGPGKEWFFDATQSGGGCLMDLGIHLVDLLLWILDDPLPEVLSGRLFAKGVPLRRREHEVEDFALARVQLSGGLVADVSCSWNLSIGMDAEIGIRFRGTDGSLVLQNVAGSYYDFLVVHHRGRSTEVIAEPPDAWGGRAIAAWADALAAGSRYRETVRSASRVAQVLDRIYADAIMRDKPTGEERTSWQENPEPQPTTMPFDRGLSVAEAFPSE